MGIRERGTKVEVPVPSSFALLLCEFRGCFSAWTFPVFCALVLRAARPECPAHRVRDVGGGPSVADLEPPPGAPVLLPAKWSVDQLSVVLARLVVRTLVPVGEAVLVAIDDTLFTRRGPKVFAASWFHDGSAAGHQEGRLWQQLGHRGDRGQSSRSSTGRSPCRSPSPWSRKAPANSSRLADARRLVTMLSGALGGRRIDVVADAAYAGKVLKDLPAGVTWTTRLRSNAALFGLAPARTGRRGRPRMRGAKLASLSQLAKKATFSPERPSLGTPRPPPSR